MRRSVQPSWPSARTCFLLSSLKMLVMLARGTTIPPPRQRLERLLPMAGFEVSTYGRIWVSTEVTLSGKHSSRVAVRREILPTAGRRRPRHQDEASVARTETWGGVQRGRMAVPARRSNMSLVRRWTSCSDLPQDAFAALWSGPRGRRTVLKAALGLGLCFLDVPARAEDQIGRA